MALLSCREGLGLLAAGIQRLMEKSACFVVQRWALQKEPEKATIADGLEKS